MNNKRYMVAISIIALSLSAKNGTKPLSTDDIVAAVTTTTNRDQVGVQTAPAAPNLNHFRGYASLSALVWNVLQDAADIAYSDQFINQTSNIQELINTQTVDWGWNMGVKGSLGFRVSNDAWDLSLNFAYLQAKRRFVNPFLGAAQVGNTLYALYPVSGILESLSIINSRANQTFDFATYNQSNWLQFYDGNIDLAREYFISKKLSLKPIAGAKGTYIHQRSYIDYTAVLIGQSPANVTGNLTINNDFWGVGPQLGSGMRFGFTKHVSLDCQLDAAMLWGKILTKQNLETQSFNGQSLLVPFYSPIRGNKYQMVPNLNVLVGFTFDSNFSSNSKNIAFNISYENRYFWNNLGTIGALSRQKGSTSFQGLTTGLQLSY